MYNQLIVKVPLVVRHSHVWIGCCTNSIKHLICMMCCVLAGVLCQRPFCHMYWGCQRIGCQGCLARFSGMYLFQQNSPRGIHR